jgi:murein DD-endopeptidase MepM/ murein hydrolase activator NlpD
VPIKQACSTVEPVVVSRVRAEWLSLLLIWPLAAWAQTPLQLQALPPLPMPERVPPETPVADLVPASSPDAGTVETPAPVHVIYPLARPAIEVNPYGWRYSDTRQLWRMHTGQDLIAPAGTLVLAMMAGRVVLAEERDGYGLTLMLEHGGGWQSLYAHLQTTLQAVGTWVAAGTPLGQVGQSGRASTPHLHVEWRRRTPQGTMAVNPTALLEQAMGMAFVQR